MWKSKVFTLLTRISVVEKSPNMLKRWFMSSYSFKRINRDVGRYVRKNLDSSRFESNEDSSGNERNIEPVKHVFCKELNETDVKRHVALKGKIISGAGYHWLMKDKSGSIYLHVPENKKEELEDWILKFRPNVLVEVTGIVKKNLKNDEFPYKISLKTVSFLKLMEVKRNEDKLLLNLNPKELSKISSVHMSWFFQRSHTLGQLNEEIVGQGVTLCGWVSWICDSNKTLFMLEDGVDRVLIDCGEKATDLGIKLEDLEVNFIVLLDGEVVKRTNDEINPNLKSGTIKVCLKDIKEMDKIDEEALDQYHNLQSNSNDFQKEKENYVTNPVIEADPNLYTLRSHNLGEINSSLVGQRVHLMGWVIFSRMNQFLVLKDKYGTVQLLLSKKMFEQLNLGLESVIAVEGIVRDRPEKQILQNNPSGAVEVHVTDVKVISRADEMPFTLKTFNAKPFLLLQYRYLDLRMSSFLQKNLNLRCQILNKMRRFLIENLGFLEVETPVLSRSSPGGAQEFIVPTREKGKFYGLVQSPQLFKQMLMIGAVDRYFQIARCFRDETGRKDRQPEFTQLDLEMSFCDMDGVLNLVEDLLGFVWPSHLPPLEVPFPRLTYSEAMRLYRTDKPDLRFKIKVVDLTEELIKDETFQNYLTFTLKGWSDVVVEGLTLPIEWGYKKELEGTIKGASNNYRVFRYMETSEKELEDVFSGFCNIGTVNIIRSKLDLKHDDVFILIFGVKNNVENLLKEIQSLDFTAFKNGTECNNSFEFVWITDFPLFETDKDGKIQSVHHPFTQPVEEDMALLNENPLKVRGQHYDLVLNGNEIGGGSMRIHDRKLQKKILKKILQLDEEPFQHFLRALSYGVPIHGGFALGIDRFIAILQGHPSIEDVIAFPKFHSGQDPLSGAPCEISDDDKRLYHVESGTVS